MDYYVHTYEPFGAFSLSKRIKLGPDQSPSRPYPKNNPKTKVQDPESKSKIQGPEPSSQHTVAVR